jgi:hypothetical protein
MDYDACPTILYVFCCSYAIKGKLDLVYDKETLEYHHI